MKNKSQVRSMHRSKGRALGISLTALFVLALGPHAYAGPSCADILPGNSTYFSCDPGANSQITISLINSALGISGAKTTLFSGCPSSVSDLTNVISGKTYMLNRLTSAQKKTALNDLQMSFGFVATTACPTAPVVSNNNVTPTWKPEDEENITGKPEYADYARDRRNDTSPVVNNNTVISGTSNPIQINTTNTKDNNGYSSSQITGLFTKGNLIDGNSNNVVDGTNTTGGAAVTGSGSRTIADKLANNYNLQHKDDFKIGGDLPPIGGGFGNKFGSGISGSATQDPNQAKLAAMDSVGQDLSGKLIYTSKTSSDGLGSTHSESSWSCPSCTDAEKQRLAAIAGNPNGGEVDYLAGAAMVGNRTATNGNKYIAGYPAGGNGGGQGGNAGVITRDKDGNYVRQNPDGTYTKVDQNGVVGQSELDADKVAKLDGEVRGRVTTDSVKNEDWVRTTTATGPCANGATIDGKYGCGLTNTLVTTSQIGNAAGQIGGAVAMQSAGQSAYNNVVAGGGGVSATYNAQADLMDKAAKTQKMMGYFNTAMGMAQMAMVLKHQKNSDELVQTQKETQQKGNYSIATGETNSDGRTDGQGYITGKSTDKGAKGNVGKIVSKFQLNEMATLKNQAITGGLTIDLKGATCTSAPAAPGAEAPVVCTEAVTNKVQTFTSREHYQSAVFRDEQTKKKLALMKREATNIAKDAALEQQNMAQKAMSGMTMSLQQGGQQLANAAIQKAQAEQARTLAAQFKDQGLGPQLTLANTSANQVNSGYKQGSIGGSGLAEIAQATAAGAGNNNEYMNNNPGGQTPFGTGQDNQGPTGAVARAGNFIDGGATGSGGAGGGGAAGGAAGGGGARGAPAAAAAAAKVGQGMQTDSGKAGANYVSLGGTTQAGAGGGGGDGSLADMMRKMIEGQGGEDGTPKGNILAFGGSRDPASAGRFYNPEDDLFKGVSAQYRAQAQSGKVGIQK